METVQIVLDKRLLQATDRAARRLKRNRSALVREALREHLRRLEVRTREERDREGLFEATANALRSASVGSGGVVAGRIARGDVRLQLCSA
jgi:metal-responsive CopG/Arc/MetJ family transcriptional regulator